MSVLTKCSDCGTFTCTVPSCYHYWERENVVDKMNARIELAKESRKRIGVLKFGARVTNVCAGQINPHRHAYFVKFDRRKGYVQCTDKEGSFWETDMEVIYPGHICYRESKKIYKPIHAVNF